MTQKIDPFISSNWGWDDGENGWGLGMNENLIQYAFFHNRRIDAILANASLLPTSPVDGTAYFTTADTSVYFRAEGQWYSAVPPIGMRFVLKGSEVEYKFNGSALVVATAEISDVVGLQSELDAKVDDSQVGAVNGVAPLGADSKVPSAYLPESGSYQGTWNANTNTPTIVSSTGSNGDFYIVSVAGATTIDGTSVWAVGDQIRFDGTVWQKIPNTQAVSSVNGETGAVVLNASDVGATPSSHVGSGGTQHANATTSVAGFLSSTDKIKLDGIAANATANQTNSYLLSRANHTGSQAQSTITNLVTDLSAKQATLVSGTNIKTINGASILGSGDIVISGGGGSTTFTALTDTPASYTGNAEKVVGVKLDESGLEFVSLGTAAFSNVGDFATASHTHDNATTSLAGFMSAADKTKLNSFTGTFTSALETKLNGIAAGAEVNVNADWNSVSGDSQILNKPDITTSTSDEVSGRLRRTQDSPGYSKNNNWLGTQTYVKGSTEQIFSFQTPEGSASSVILVRPMESSLLTGMNYHPSTHSVLQHRLGSGSSGTNNLRGWALTVGESQNLFAADVSWVSTALGNPTGGFINDARSVNIEKPYFNGIAAPTLDTVQTFTGEKSFSQNIITKTASYAGNQDSPYLIAATPSYTGATTTSGTYGIQHRLKSDAGGTFRITVDSNQGELFCINAAGRVGIGTSNPTQALDVVGNIKASGNVSVLDVEVGGRGSANTPEINFHSGAVDVDYDARIIVSGGDGISGNGAMTFTAASFSFVTGPISGNGSGLTSLNATNLTSGTLPSARLSGTYNITNSGSSATLTTGRTIGMTGDVTWTSGSFNGSANVTGTATLANSGVTAGTYKSVTVDAKGRVTAGSNPTTFSGYGIVDTLNNLSNVTITSVANGEILRFNGTNWINNTLAEAGIQPAGSYLTGNQTITLSGDATGSGTTSVTVTLLDSGVTAGSYGSSISVPTYTVDAKGRLTSASNTTIRSGTTSQTGVVQLSSATNSTSTTLAATPSAVKSAYDLADSKAPTSSPVFTGSATAPVFNTNSSGSSYDVSGAANSGDAIPVGLAFHDAFGWSASTIPATTVLTVKNQNTRTMQVGTSNGGQLYFRALHTAVDNTVWRRAWDTVDLPNPATEAFASNASNLTTGSLPIARLGLASVNAGNGLTGGGALSSAQTITLGTPSTITGSTTNSVTSTSHTHAISSASTTVAGVVQLNNTTSSTSTTQAATANAVKLVNDGLVGKVDVAAPSQLFQNIGSGSGSRTINGSSGIHVIATATGNTTWTFPSPASTEAHALTLELTNGGAYTMTWPAGTRWAGGVAPTLTASGTDILVFTKAGTANWRGYLSSKDNK